MWGGKKEKFLGCRVLQFHHQNFDVQSTACLLGVMYVCMQGIGNYLQHPL